MSCGHPRYGQRAAPVSIRDSADIGEPTVTYAVRLTILFTCGGVGKP